MIGPIPAVSIPSIDAADRPTMPVSPAASWPPSTGLANVIGRGENHEVGLRIQVRIQADIDVSRNSADLNFSRCRDVAGSTNARMIIDGCGRPAWCLRNSGQAAKLSRKPKGHAAFVSVGNLRSKHEQHHYCDNARAQRVRASSV